MTTEDEESAESTGRRIAKTSKKFYKKTTEGVGKVVGKGVELSATGIDKSTGASKYQKDAIAIINPKNGSIEAIINLSELKNKVTKHAEIDVLNGIAYNPATKTYFVTGKNWDKVFEIIVE